MKAWVHVTLKKDVLDPQGKAIQKAGASLGYGAVKSVRQGKIFEVELDAPDRKQAQAKREYAPSTDHITEFAGRALQNNIDQQVG